MTDKFRDGNDLPALARQHAEELGLLRSLVIRIYNHGYQAGHEDAVEACFVLIHHAATYHADVVAKIILENDSSSANHWAEEKP